MILDRIAVTGLRNLDQLEIMPSPSINWITGLNGAGKTSFLEAIFLLSRGRSFSSRKHGSAIGAGHDSLVVSALIRPQGHEPGPGSSLKFAQSRTGATFVENGATVASVHLLRRRLHVRLIAGNAQQLLEGPPHLRRLFLDWNLFHVEPGYGVLLADLKKISAQRNAWLRSGAIGPPAWDLDYCRLSAAISQLRTKLVARMSEFFLDLAPQVGLDNKVELSFHEGWPSDKGPLDGLLANSVREDAWRGYTYYGPSRADFAVRFSGRSTLPSRGESKLLVFLMQLAAQKYWVLRHGPEAVWLLDDLGSELDLRAIQKILAALEQSSSQVFVSAIAGRDMRPSGHLAGPVFHVEQGKLVGLDSYL